MSSRIIISIIIIGCLLIPAGSGADTEQEDFALQIYLPREVTVKSDILRLGQVAVIRGDEALVGKAGGIAVGRISVPGQEVIVNRTMVLSRLACNGVPAPKVKLTGAEETTVKQQQQIIKAEEFVERAKAFLNANLPAGSVYESSPVLMPKDLVLEGPSRDIKLSARLVRDNIRNVAKVQIAALANGKQVGMREAAFRLKYNCRQVVALVDIPTGAVISAENVRIEKTLSNYPEAADWSPPYGLIAKRRLPANTVILPNMVAPVNPPIIVGRNQTVVIQFETPGLLVTAIGKAMQQGRAGEYVKVQNTDSRRIIIAKVNENGTVEPVF